MQRTARMKREMSMFVTSPPHGISCWLKGDSLEDLEAQIIGDEDSPYAGGIFKLSIVIPERYPFEPPNVRFITPIYHPNIDSAGRICLDSLKMPPKGAWKPALNLLTLLTTIQLLMAEPNLDDPLMADIAEEYRTNKSLFEKKAKEWTKKYAIQKDETLADEVMISSPTVTQPSGTVSTKENMLPCKRSMEDNDSKLPLRDALNKRPKS